MDKKIELPTSFVIILLLLSSFVMPVIANDENSNIIFNAFVAGKGVSNFGIPMGSPAEGPCTGMVGISGTAEANWRLWGSEEYPHGWNEECYISISEGLEATGFVIISWKNTWIRAELYSTSMTEGYFQLNEWFIVSAFPTTDINYLLRFNGILVANNDVIEISGFAAVIICPYNRLRNLYYDAPPHDGEICMVLLFDEVQGLAYTASWTSETIPKFQQLGMDKHIGMPSAKIFQWNVELES